MRKIGIIVSLLLLGSASSFSQTKENLFVLGGGISASTNGVGGNIYWNPAPKWKVQGGYEAMSFRLNFDFEQSNLSMDAKVRYKTGGAFLTAGYQILDWLYATGGIELLIFNPEMKAVPQGDYKYGDIYIKPEVVGDVHVKVKSGTSVAPYLALGFGKQSAYYKRVACGFEVGGYYMGSPKLDMYATGMLSPSEDPNHVETIRSQISRYRFYPVLKLNIAVKFYSK